MKTSNVLFLTYCIVLIIYHFPLPILAIKHEYYSTHEAFLQCLSQNHHTSISNLTYTQENVAYSSVLNFTIQNLRFSTSSTPKPLAIITPFYESQIQQVIYCSRKHGFQIRIRSGGHDYEGLSYTSSQFPFIVIDLINLKSIHVDVTSQTAWVQSGATLGELYNKIAEKNPTLGFPGAICTTVGIGGYLSGGGYGALLRKYGLAGDNVIDARFIDANGRILDRKSMGEDVFWAIRGGGGGSFGVVVAWKVKLVPVPQNVTVFRILKTIEQNATELLHRWQYVAPKLPQDIFMGVTIVRVNSSRSGKTTIQVGFSSLFLGGVDKLVQLMRENFPELGLLKQDCIEMSWTQSISYFDASFITRPYFKAKSDYVQEPISIKGLEGLWRRLSKNEAEGTGLGLVAYGGKMNEISESALPFPHRAGNLYILQYFTSWNNEDDPEASKRHINWTRKLYIYMAPYVSKNPRAAYINYRDLDIGVNNKTGNTSYAQASVWGIKYFGNNFHKLARVKTKIDLSNFFRHEQSIPLIS